MADVVVKQLFQSPEQPYDGTIKFTTDNNVVRRLDDSLGDCWLWTSAANPGHQPTPTFKAPSDSEDEWDDPDSFDDYRSSRAGLQLQQQQPAAQSPFSDSRCVNNIISIQQQHPVQAVLQARTKQLQADALLLAEQQQQRLHQQIQSVEEHLAQQLAEVQQQLQHKRARAAAADEESRLRRSAERHRRLQEVQRQQQALEQAGASALQEVKRAQEEAARQRAEAEARQRQQQEEQRKKKEAEAAAAAAAAQAAEQANAREAAAKARQQQQAAATTAAAGAAAQPAAAAAASKPAAVALARPSDPHLKSTAAALEYEQLLAAKLSEAEALAAELISNVALKQQRRALEKQITMAVSQISGTQQQVQDKSRQLIGVLESCSSPQQQALAYTTLASRIVSQCDGQVQKIGSFAFPLAYVCVAVGARVPAFMELLLAKLQKACPLLVPKYTMYSPDQPKDDWFRGLGYVEVEDNKSRQMRRETSDEFVARMSAMVLLYASVVQTEAAGNPAGLGHGWTWLARCLNALPPTRPTAVAVMSFLAHAGYRMAAVYGRQFQKLMLHLTEHYIPALEAKASKDADLRAVGTRLQTYVSTQQYRKEPEGRSLKKVDESSYLRA